MINECDNKPSSSAGTHGSHRNREMSVGDFRKKISKYSESDTKAAKSIVSYYFRGLLEDRDSPLSTYVKTKGNSYYELVLKVLEKNLQNDRTKAIEYLNTQSAIKTAVKEIYTEAGMMAREIRKRTIYEFNSLLSGIEPEQHTEYTLNLVSRTRYSAAKEEKQTRE